MKPKRKTTVTSVRLPPELIQAVKDEGVGNMSKLVTGLLERWLEEAREMDVGVAEKVRGLHEELAGVQDEWWKYVKEQSRAGHPGYPAEIYLKDGGA